MESIDNTIQDLIDNYLLGRMPEEEKARFEAMMKNDKILSHEVEIQKLIKDEIEERNSFFQVMNNAEKKRRSRQRYLYAIAASLFVFVTIGIWQPTRKSNTYIFNTYCETFPITEKDINTDNGTRGSNNEFDSVEQKIIKRSIEEYENNNFWQASSDLEKIDRLIERNAYYGLVMAISQLNSGNAKKASLNLQYLRDDQNNFSQREIASFYLALSKVKLGKPAEARKILKKLESDHGEYSKKSSEILKKMRYF